jgi:1-acyl-sn-glycerol-3-phosphate acyltransferase
VSSDAGPTSSEGSGPLPPPRELDWRWGVIVALGLGPFWLAGWRPRVRGLEHVPRVGGAVLAFNHHSYVDFIMLGWPVLRDVHRPVRYIGKREAAESPWLSWAARWGDVVPVDRQSLAGRAGAFREAVDALRSGDLVAIAPEQTISPSFELLPFRVGAVRMAQEAGVPIVPVVGWGSQRLRTKGGRFGRFLRVPVDTVFCPPVVIGADEDAVEATRRLQDTMTRVLHGLQESYVDGAPAGAPWVPRRLGGGAPDHADVLAAHLDRTRGWEGQERDRERERERDRERGAPGPSEPPEPGSPA